jgi:hypothetical protein
LTAGCLVLGSVVPFTLIAIWPTDKQLEGSWSRYDQRTRSQPAGPLGPPARYPLRAHPGGTGPDAVYPGLTFRIPVSRVRQGDYLSLVAPITGLLHELDRIVERQGLPLMILSHNSMELTSHGDPRLAGEGKRGLALHRTGKPMQNRLVESLIGA